MLHKSVQLDNRKLPQKKYIYGIIYYKFFAVLFLIISFLAYIFIHKKISNKSTRPLSLGMNNNESEKFIYSLPDYTTINKMYENFDINLNKTKLYITNTILYNSYIEIYEHFQFNKSYIESPIYVDLSSSAPRYPNSEKENEICFKKGFILSKINSIPNLSCIDIKGVTYEDDFNISLSLLNKTYDINNLMLFDIFQINIKEEKKLNHYENETKNLINYYNNSNTKNIRYCSKKLNERCNNLLKINNMYQPVIKISWKEKNKIFCLNNISLIYKED